MLKKSLKQKLKKKERSKKQWEERKSAQQVAQQEKQQKREANLKKRKGGPAGPATTTDAAEPGKAGGASAPKVSGPSAGGVLLSLYLTWRWCCWVVSLFVGGGAEAAQGRVRGQAPRTRVPQQGRRRGQQEGRRAAPRGREEPAAAAPAPGQGGRQSRGGQVTASSSLGPFSSLTCEERPAGPASVHHGFFVCCPALWLKARTWSRGISPGLLNESWSWSWARALPSTVPTRAGGLCAEDMYDTAYRWASTSFFSDPRRSPLRARRRIVSGWA